jgi:hypothetical protein
MACLPGALVLACIEKRLVSRVGYGAYDIQKVAQPISARRLRMRHFDSLHSTSLVSTSTLRTEFHDHRSTFVHAALKSPVSTPATTALEPAQLSLHTLHSVQVRDASLFVRPCPWRTLG